MTKEYTIKVVVIGDMFTGKTSLVHNCNNNYNLNNYESTIGVDFSKKTIEFNNNIYKLFIWDTSGQEKFNSIITSYYRDTDAVIFVFDITNYNSFLNIQNWIGKVELYSNNKIMKILVGNKNDLDDNRVDKKIITKFCKNNNIEYLETSAKNNINIDEIFLKLVNNIDNNTENNSGIKIHNTFSLNETKNSRDDLINLNKKKYKCCNMM